MTLLYIHEKISRVDEGENCCFHASVSNLHHSVAAKRVFEAEVWKSKASREDGKLGLFSANNLFKIKIIDCNKKYLKVKWM